MVYEYGFWPIVVINVAIFLLFAISFLKPRKKFEWRSMGVFSAFIVALFTEMYGFPLTIYILTSYFGYQLPVFQPFSHVNGHLLGTLLGASENMKIVICQIGSIFMGAGIGIMGWGWWFIHKADGELVTSGPYKYVRHPQYTGLFLITIGMLIQWPTIITLVMWPVLTLSYIRLAKKEEKIVIEEFGEKYLDYRSNTPAFFPNLRQIFTNTKAGDNIEG